MATSNNGAEKAIATIRVLHTIPPASSTTNPFVSLLVDHLPAHVHSEYWSWKRALFSSFDVLHFQWPENLVTGNGLAKVWLKRIAFFIVLLRVLIMRIGVVQTVHNIEPHEERKRVERVLLRLQERCVHVRILLNDAQPAPVSARAITIVIPHGDYSPSYAVPARPVGDPHSLLYFGLIRSYKQVPQLVRAFLQLRDSRARLAVLGKPWTREHGEEVAEAAASSPFVRLVLADIEEQDLVREILSAGLVVLPYAKLYNSGALLLALTLKTPVLVPATPTTRQIQDEVGERWLMTYEGELTANTLEAAMDRVSTLLAGRYPDPDLSGRDWRRLGEDYAAAYFLAAQRALGGRR